MPRRVITVGLMVWLALTFAAPTPGQEPTVRELERERIRGDIETILAMLNDPESARRNRGIFYDATESLVALGPAAVEYLAVEIDQPSAATFHIACNALGRLGGAQAIAALRQALERIQGEPGKFAKSRKEWVTYALAVAGDTEAVALLETFPHRIGGREFMRDTRLIDVVALLTAPDSIPILAAHLERYLQDPEGEEGAIRVVRALGRVGGAEVRPLLLPLLEHPSARLRSVAVEGLGNVADATVIPALLARLDDGDGHVERQAMRSIVRLADSRLMERLEKRLEKEDNVGVRTRIYQLLGEFRGGSAVPTLVAQLKRSDFLDRVGAVDALGMTGAAAAVPPLRLAAVDPDGGVRARALAALGALGRLGVLEAREALLANIIGASWTNADEAIEQLIRLDDRRAGPRIVERLQIGELSGVVDNVRLRAPIELMGEALVRFEHPAAVHGLEQALAKQTDRTVIRTLQSVIRRLRAIEEHGGDVDAWASMLAAADPATSELAARRLARIGSRRAAAALDSALDAEASPELGERILAAIADTPAGAFRPLVERVLADPRFDARRHRRERGLAGRAARRIGGRRMISALRQSVERREGLDLDVLVALALADGNGALEALRSTRNSRLRSYSSFRGLEVARIDWLIDRIVAGRTLAELDRSPEDAPLRNW